MVVRILLDKPCATEYHAYLNQMSIGQDSVSWLLGTPKQSLGFILADGGFDVWFANTRGTNSSRNHTSLSPNDPVFLTSLVNNAFYLGFSLIVYWLVYSQAYWDWTWDELAAYDLPAVLQFVYDHTGRQKVHYIGHSLVSSDVPPLEGLDELKLGSWEVY